MKVEVLGSVQDGGVPHMGCSCDLCEEARENRDKIRYVNSVMIQENNDSDAVRYLLGPSPDIRFQIKGEFLDGVFVSDNHLGDITGLLFLGESSMDASGVPVFCSEGVEHFIMNNDPYRYLVDRENIQIETVETGEEVDVQGGSVEIREVVHRGDYADTLSFMIHGEDKKVYYVSDLDKWTDDAIESVREADIAIVDGCFWTKEELDRYEEVPHPPVKETMEIFEDADTDIYFTHMNHTNPVLREDSEERQQVEDNGFGVVEKGMTFEI